MKRKSIFFLSALGIALLASCSPGGEPSSSSVPDSSAYSSSQGVVTVEDNLYLGLFASSEYVPNIKGSYEVSYSDPSMAKYENGCVLTYDKTGAATIRFSSSSKEVVLTVHVDKDATIPVFEIEHSDLSMFAGSTYELPYSLRYGGRDVTAYLSSVSIVKEIGDEVADLEQKDSKIIIHSKQIGVATFTIGAEFLGNLVSQQLTLTVKEDKSFFIYGEKMRYDDEGPKYEVKLLGGSSSIDLKNDLKAKNNGRDVPYSSLEIELAENDFATLDTNGTLTFSKVGTTNLTVTYAGNAIAIRLIAYKEIDSTYDIKLADRDFSLEKGVSVTSAGRSYGDPSSEAIKSIVIPSDYGQFSRAESLFVDGQEIHAEEASYLSFDASSGSLKLDSRLFDASIYGVKSVSVVLEGEFSLVKFNFDILFITKTIATYEEFSKYISQKNASDTILGYFTLANDIDAKGVSSPGSWTTSGWNFSAGFRGTLDGRGHAIKNMTAGEYGLSGIIGSGAILQNLDFDNLTYVSSSSDGKKLCTLFARGMKEVTLRNINISLSSSSVTDVGDAGLGKSMGLFTIEKAEKCQFEYVKVDASGFDLLTLVGKQASNTVYSDCEVICRSLKYVYGDSDVSKVTGIKVTNA